MHTAKVGPHGKPLTDNGPLNVLTDPEYRPYSIPFAPQNLLRPKSLAQMWLNALSQDLYLCEVPGVPLSMQVRC